MPEMVGVQLVTILKNKERNGELDFSKTALAALTALNEEQIGNWHAIGFDIFLNKPVSWEKLKTLFE